MINSNLSMQNNVSYVIWLKDLIYSKKKLSYHDKPGWKSRKGQFTFSKKFQLLLTNQEKL